MTADMMTYAPDKGVPSKQAHPDIEMEAYFMLGDMGTMFIIHDRPFTKTLSWIEYNITTSRLDFVMEDGDLRNFGIPVDPKFGAYIQNSHTIPVAQMVNGKVVAGHEFPLITHRD